MAQAARMRVDYFFDVISPYSCLSWTVLQRYTAVWGMELNLVPMFLGGVMRATGNQPPAMVPARGLSMERDLKRNAAFFQVPILATPGNFFTTAAREILQCQRLIVAAQLLDQLDKEAVVRLVSACTSAVHLDPLCRTEDNDLHSIDEAFLAACCKKAGLDDAVAKELLDMRGSPQVKSALQSNTESAIDAGAFGSPTIVFHPSALDATGESEVMIFGSDRFEQAAFLLGKPWFGPRGPPAGKL